jgi:ABC-type ATPase involved in cell division
MAEQTLLEWSNEQPAWVCDALRRHAQSSGGSLSDEAKAEIALRVRHHAGFTVEPAPTCTPLDATHLKTEASASKRTEFCSLGPVENLNRLATGQKMNFTPKGITLIYGDNGSGKSGYARVTKKLCRSLAYDELLSNVFEATAKPAAKINIRYRAEGDTEVTETTWVDGTPPPQALSQISVFDSQNARLYVDRQNKIGFLPADIELLQRHGSYCSEMDTAFKKESEAITKRVKVPLPGGYTPSGIIAKTLARLDLKSKEALPSADDLKTLGNWTETLASELKELKEQLAKDPGMLAAQRRRAKATLEAFAVSLALIESGLSKEAVDQLAGLQTTAIAASEAAALAASDRFASYPVKGVGQSPWELMYNYAKAYGESLGISQEKLPDAVGENCVLCQEPLTEAAAARVTAFNEYMAGTASKAALAARQAVEKALAGFRGVQITSPKQTELNLGEFGGLGEARKVLAKEISDYCATSIARRDGVLAAATVDALSAVPQLPNSLATKLSAETSALEAEADAFDEIAQKDSGRAKERARIAELEDQKRLADSLETILARREDLDSLKKLAACSAAVGTLKISQQITSLRRSLVMEDLEKRILEEIGALDLTHIPFSVSDNSQDGQSLFGVAVKAAKATSNSKVLSEGEQRALALACFLGEVGIDAVKHGLIIDDPVSSLDHTRIRRVAERLVAEAKEGRQVIIFTHNILFFNEVREAASRAMPQVPVLPNYISKSAKAGFGIISQSDEPWVLMSVSKRIGVLGERWKSFAEVTDFDADEWRRSAKDFYTDLRETWERLVEEALLYKVIERFNAEVKTQSLKGVVVEDDDYQTIFWAMKRVSERSGHDMAAGKNVPTPKPSDMKSDLDTIDAFRTLVQKRRKDAEERRKKLEEPPKAEVA